MDNRFNLKDFVFLVLLLTVIGLVCFGIWQYGYEGQRVTAVVELLQRLNETQKAQLAALEELKRSGVRVQAGPAATASAGTQTAGDADGAIRRTEPDGTYTVIFPNLPKNPRDPRSKADYAQGDWIVENLGDEPGTITPYIARTASENTVSDQALEGLLTRHRFTLEYQPWVAESYTISPDKLTFRFVIRPNVVFSDGHPLTADDVVFTYDTIMNKDVEADTMRSYIMRIESCKKIDDRTVEFHFKEPYFEALGVCSFGILPKHIYKFNKAEEYNNNKTQVVGSGPYRMERWDRGQKLVMTRNERYWGPKPTFDKIVYVFIINPQAAFQSFQSEQLDEFSPDPEQYEKFTKDPEFAAKFKFYKYVPANLAYRYIGWNQAMPMFKDKLTRQALTMLINRAAIIKTIQRGMAVETSGPFNPTSPQYNSRVKPWPYDPEAAKKKLAEAGWKPGPDGVLTRDGEPFKFDLEIPAGSPNAEKTAVYIKEQFEKAGIRVRITPYEFSVLSERLDARKAAAAMLGWGGGSGEDDPTQIWHSQSIEGKGSNWVAFRNAETDALIEKAIHELDTEKRMALWHRFHEIVHEEQPYTFLQQATARAFVNSRFENTEPDAMGLDSGSWYVPANRQKYK